MEPSAEMPVTQGALDSRAVHWKEWEATREEADAQVSALEQQLLELKTKRNLVSPISILPDDIMNTIFFEVKRNAEAQAEQRRSWILSSHVCRRWRDLMLDSPLLWSGFAPGDLALLEQSLARSREAPLVLKFESNDLLLSAQSVLQKALAQTTRLKDVTLQGHATTLQGLLAPLITNAPLLESLSIECTDGTGSLSPGFLNQEAPALKELRLKDYTIPLTSNLLRGLTLLKIHIESGMATNTGEEILDALRSMPDLAELNLDMDGVDTEGLTTTPQLVELPNMKKLRLDRCGRIFPTLRIPSSCTVSVSCQKTSNGDLEWMAPTFVSCWLPASPCDDPPLKSIRVEENSASKTAVTLFGWPQGYHTTNNNAQFRLILERESAWTVELHHSLIHLARLNRVHTVCLWWWMEPPEWVDLVPRFTSARGLHVPGSEDSYRILRALRENAAPVEEGARATPCLPKLESLRFQDANFDSEFSGSILVDELLDILEIRSQAGIPLKGLVFKDCSGVGSKAVLKALCTHLTGDIHSEK